MVVYVSFVAFFCTLSCIPALDCSELLIVVICHSNVVSQRQCLALETEFTKTSANPPWVLLTHRDLPHHGDWAILPIVPELLNVLSNTTRWVVIVSEYTHIEVEKLVQWLRSCDPQQSVFLGHVQSDPEPTIIHHFNPAPLFYPVLPAGVVLSKPALIKLADAAAVQETADFSIDASYELALLLESSGLGLTHVPELCVKPGKGCFTHVSTHPSPEDKGVSLDKIFFAVKTCEKFHRSRLSVVKSTWGSQAKHITYYSDSFDASIPTIKLNARVTLQGHCDKTQHILIAVAKVFKSRKELEWVVICDDDTILSVSRIAALASMYNPRQAIAVGERYGYKLQKGGYNYLTGGAGVLLSRAALRLFQRYGCPCPEPHTPDDMFLFGICLRRLNITLIHSPLMHQARPNDYSEAYLSLGAPISFHKHWMVDPVVVYKQFFQPYDEKNFHNEL